MEVIGIIAEYNPFHNGHLYHITKIKELYPDAILILILNGYFLQRGEVSVLTKEDKTKIALDYGIDLVVELPFLYGSQSADIFALHSIKLLNALGATKLVFGSESNNIELLQKIASIQLYDPDYQNLIKKYLDKGENYPTALSKALHIKEDFNKPNDLLGISYVKAIQITNSTIVPETIQRTNDYHDTKSNDDIVSASNIREKIKQKEDIASYVPKGVKNKIIFPSSYYDFVKFKILTSKDVSVYLTVDEGIENRLLKGAMQSNTLEEFIEYVKTKRYTYNKIHRMLIHILVGVTKEDNMNSELEYIKILGFNKKGQAYLKKAKRDSPIPIAINRESLQYKYEMKASLMYDLLTKQNTYTFELNNKPIKK